LSSAAARAPASLATATSESSGLTAVPIVTLGLIAVLAVIFWFEQTAALNPQPGLGLGYRTLMALGGANGRLVFHDGQVWRLFTAPLLHASLTHIAGNCVVLLLVGWRLERLIGRAWFAAIFFVSALGGSLGSVLLNARGPVSVGASGAIMGLLAAAFVCSFHLAAYETRGKLRVLSLRLIIPALMPTSGLVDYSCHFGGAATGAMLGFVLQIVWPEMEDRPRFGQAAAVAAGLCAALSLAAFVTAGLGYAHVATREDGLIPDTELPHGEAEIEARAAGLSVRYPRDPRGHFYRAIGDLKAQDAAGAESELRAALAQSDVLDTDMPPSLRPTLSGFLAATLHAEGRDQEARPYAGPACGATDPGLAKLKAALVKAKLCG
jgi:membrane associated rhomboid family serine protease